MFISHPAQQHAVRWVRVPSGTGAVYRRRRLAFADAAVQQTGQHVLHHRALAYHAFDGFAHRQRLGKGVEEVTFATDDLDLRLGQRRREHFGLIFGDFLVGGDGGHGLVEVLLQLHAELLVLTRVVAERIERTELLAQTFSLGIQTLQQHMGFGHTQILSSLGLGCTELFFATRLGAEFLFQHLGVGQAAFFLGGIFGFGHTRLGQAFLLVTLGFSDQLLGMHTGFGQAFLLLGGGGDFAYPRIGQTRRSALGLDTFGHFLLGLGLLGRGFQLGLSQVVDFHSLVLGTGFVGFGLLDLAHQLLLGFGLGIEHHDLLVPICFGHFTHFLDALFFLGHGLLDRHTLADHSSDILTLHFQGFLFLDALQLDFALAGDDFQILGAGDFFHLYDHRTLAVLLRHLNLALMVLSADIQLLLGSDARLLGLQALFFLDLEGLGFFAGADGFDLALLPRLGIGLLTLKSQGRLAGLHVLLLDRQLFVALQIIGNDVLRSSQLSDLADTLGIENIARVERCLGGLLQVVDGHVFQHIAVKIVADHLNDTGTKLLAIFEQLNEVELFADSFH